MIRNPIIWFDITNTPQVHFLLAIGKSLNEKGYSDFIYSAREFSETVTLLKLKLNSEFTLYGAHYGKKNIRKIIGLFSRFLDVYRANINYDISISCGSENAIWLSKLKKKMSIAFGDNDHARQWTYGHFVDYAFFPDAIERNVLERQGLRNKLYLYHGYKEDIYLADFVPKNESLSQLPFDNYVVVRPENIMANYIRNKKIISIIPKLLQKLEKGGFNILYLPRYDFDKDYASGLKRVYIPEQAIDGLNACYYATAVLTGAGTLAREAACLGIPSFSFYAGSDLLAVDKQLIKQGKMVYSRDVDILVDKLICSKKNSPDILRSKAVKDEVIFRLLNILN